MDSSFERKPLSRQDFLKAAGLAGGGLMIAGFPQAAGARTFVTRRIGAGPSLAGKTVAISSPIDVEVLKEFYDDQRNQAKLPGNGEKIVVVDANLDTVKQHTQVDQLIDQGVNAIVLFVLTVTGWEDTVARARKKGIGMFNHSASPILGCNQNVGLDQRAAGFAVGRAAAGWIDKTQGGEAQIGVLSILNDPQLTLRSAGFKAAIEQYSPNSVIAREAFAQTRDVGASATANMLQSAPGISVIFSGGDDPGLGALTAAHEAGKTDSKKFYIGSCDGTQAVLDEIKKLGIYQSTWSFLFAYSATALQRDIEHFLRKEKIQPTRIERGRIIHSGNVNSFQTFSTTPLAPKNQKAYSDPAVMEYSNIPLKTGAPILRAFPKKK